MKPGDKIQLVRPVMVDLDTAPAGTEVTVVNLVPSYTELWVVSAPGYGEFTVNAADVGLE